MQGKSILLIGMPGVGKTNLAKKIARPLGMPIAGVDKALMLSQKTESVQKIVDQLSRAAFALLEETTVIDLVKKIRRPTIIDASGSIVYYPRAMRRLKKKVHVVYLSGTYRMVAERISRKEEKTGQKRGIVIKEGETLLDLYAKRVRLYRKYAHCNSRSGHSRRLAARALTIRLVRSGIASFCGRKPRRA